MGAWRCARGLFAVVPFFWTVHPVILNAIMSAIYGVFDVIIWYTVAATAYDFAVSGFVVGGLVRALSILARLIGIGISSAGGSFSVPAAEQAI